MCFKGEATIIVFVWGGGGLTMSLQWGGINDCGWVGVAMSYRRETLITVSVCGGDHVLQGRGINHCRCLWGVTMSYRREASIIVSMCGG